MKECTKSIQRRMHSPNFINKYFVGSGIDIGGKPDPLALYEEFFPLIKNVYTWDLDDGDAKDMLSIKDSTFDFVHSSHCLEHLTDPSLGLKNWIRITKPGGHIIVTVPDEDMYEQGVFPSRFNKDHKFTFTISKNKSWSYQSINVIDLLRGFNEETEIVKIELINNSFRETLPKFDQTITQFTESSIEFVIRKKTTGDKDNLGREFFREQPNKLIQTHLNQYRLDFENMKRFAKSKTPFTDNSKLGHDDE